MRRGAGAAGGAVRRRVPAPAKNARQWSSTDDGSLEVPLVELLDQPGVGAEGLEARHAPMVARRARVGAESRGSFAEFAAGSAPQQLGGLEGEVERLARR